MNEELRQMYEQDQADRRGGNIEKMVENDRVRLLRVEKLIATDALESADDYFHAAMIFQHGERLEHSWQAHELAKQASVQGHPTGRWLAAAAYDRWLMRQGKPQKYGTQYTAQDGGPYVLWEVDPNTSDAERAEWNVPPLAEALRLAEKLTQLHRQGN